MDKVIRTIVAMSFIGVVAANNVQAEESFSGTIGIGGVFIDSSNNLNPNGSQDRIDDLNSSADGESNVVPAVRVDAAYDIGAEDGWKLYFSTTPPIDEVGGFTLDFGATYNMADVGIFDGAVFVSPFAEVWEDPYLTGVDREETDSSKYGAKIGWKKIMGTGLRVELVCMGDDVDDDLIGKRIPELARDGAVYALNMNYSFYPTDNLEIRPRFSIRQGDYDGDANSFTKYKLDLEARYRIGKMAIIPRVYLSDSEYDEVNPLFNKTREDEGYGASLALQYMAPFNFKNWAVTGMVNVSEGDSNIDFYDTESVSVGGFINYRF